MEDQTGREDANHEAGLKHGPQAELIAEQIFKTTAAMLVGGDNVADQIDLGDELVICVGGPLAFASLLQLGNMALETKRNALHVSIAADTDLPVVALAYVQGDQLTLYEDCFLSMETDGAPVRIVPNGYSEGSFVLTPERRLQRCAFPASSKAALPMMRRAYMRFDELLSVMITSAIARAECFDDSTH